VPDDIVDEVGASSAVETRDRLDAWAHEVRETYQGRPSHPATRALAEVLTRFPIPMNAFLGLIEGCRVDLIRNRYADFRELEGYCELVAVTISDISLAIFGTTSPAAGALGRHLAIALQLTNICRDVGEDATRGRIYLPLDELKDHGVSEEDVLTGRVETAGYRRLMAFQCDRARRSFRAANPLPAYIRADARPAVRVMGGVYRRILDRVALDPSGAYRCRFGLSRWQRGTAVLAGVLGLPFVAR
jgi:phytoene synthase